MNNKKKTPVLGRILAVFSLALVAVSLVAEPVNAISAEQMNLFHNSIDYFNFKDEDVANCAAGAAGGGLSSIPLSGRDNIEKAFNYFVARGLSPAQSAGIVGNLIAESNVDPLINQNGSGIGHGIAQWEDSRGSGRWDVKPPVGGQIANVKDYAASKGGASMTDLGLQLEFLWHELAELPGYKGAFDDVKAAQNAGDAAVAFMIKFEAPKDRAPNGPNATKRRALANDVLAEYGGGATGAVGSLPGGTGGGQCAGGGATGGIQSIVQTAIGLAWPEPFSKANPKEPGRTSATTPTDKYRAAIAQFNQMSEAASIDCGAFVATVMKMSGADPEYPKIGTSVQYQYLTTHPEKYQIIPNPQQSDLQPGDILIITAGQRGSAFGHTWIFVGPQAGGYTAASASLGDRAPNLGNEALAGYTLARRIGAQ